MKNTLKFLILAIVGLTLSSCSKDDDLAEPNLQGSWGLTWVNNFAVDIPNAGILGQLCNPGTTVDLNFAGDAKAQFNGNRSKTNNNMYIRMGNRADNSTPNTTLASSSYYIDCNDIAVSSIEHRDIYITGQPGYITKVMENGRCVLKSERSRTRPKYTVFIKLIGSNTRVNSNTGNNETDDNNRMAGITYDCDDGHLEAVSRVGGATGPELINSKTFQGLEKNSGILSNKSSLFNK